MTREEYKRRKRTMSAGTFVVPPGAHRMRDAMQPGCKLVAVFLTDSKEHARPVDETTPEAVAAPAAWALTNLGAQIRSVRERIEQLEAAPSPNAERETLAEGDGWKAETRPDLNRIVFDFDAKPTREVTQLLRRHGFKWFRSEGVWSRSLSNGSRQSVAWVVEKLPAAWRA